MTYIVKETYLTIQGEGGLCGRVAVFCRFSGCNFWSGRESDRSQAKCDFCDTDFVGTDGEGGGRFDDASDLADHIAEIRSDAGTAHSYLVFTGGEPLLQLDEPLVRACKERNFEVAIETNGSIKVPTGVDWVCVSPKERAAELQVKTGQELKFIFPQKKLSPEEFEHLEFEHFFLQPMDGPTLQENIAEAVDYCKRHPLWRLSLQMHKMIGLP